MEQTIKGIKNFYYKLVWNSNANTMQERSDFVGEVLEKHPELVLKSRPDSSNEELPIKDGCLGRNVYGEILDYYNDWIFKGEKKTKSTASKSYYEDEKDYNKSLAKDNMYLNNENDEVIEKRFKDSNNEQVQILNTKIDNNKKQIGIIVNGGKVEGTNRRLLSDYQKLLKDDRKIIYENSTTFKDIPKANSEGLNANISTLDWSLEDPEIVEYILNLDEIVAGFNGYNELLDLKIELDGIIKSCEFNKDEELIIRLKSANQKYTENEIAELLHISRQTVRNRYAKAINKIAAKSGFSKTANI